MSAARVASPLPGVAGATRAAPLPAATTGVARPRGLSIGGPRAAGSGRLGGPAAGRNANTAAIDGAQIRRKF
jgi:hypothetical protein